MLRVGALLKDKMSLLRFTKASARHQYCTIQQSLSKGSKSCYRSLLTACLSHLAVRVFYCFGPADYSLETKEPAQRRPSPQAVAQGDLFYPVLVAVDEREH
jgi:hypothetical protein